MNAAQLHQWVLRNVRPLAAESVGNLDGLHDDHDAFMREAGRHTGIIAVESLLLDLIQQMQDDERVEREARWAEEDAAEDERLRSVG